MMEQRSDEVLYYVAGVHIQAAESQTDATRAQHGMLALHSLHCFMKSTEVQHGAIPAKEHLT